jgi:cytochrome P450
MDVTEPVISADAVEFDPFSDDFFNAPFETYRRLRNEAPVYHNEKYGFWALSRYEDVEPALKDFETYSSARGITLDMYLAEPDPAQPPMIIMMDPPDHTVMRKLVNKVFTPRAIADLEGMIRRTVTDVAGTLDRTAFDVVADFGAIFPVEIISTMLGVPLKIDNRSGCGRTSSWSVAPETSISLPKAPRPPRRSAGSITNWSANVGPTHKTT